MDWGNKKERIGQFTLYTKRGWNGDCSCRLYDEGGRWLMEFPLELRYESHQAAVVDARRIIAGGWEPDVPPETETPCPKCGQETCTVTVGKRGGWNRRTFNRCPCGWDDDPGVDEERMRLVLENAGCVKRDVPPHREGRIGMKEFIQLNDKGHDLRFD